MKKELVDFVVVSTPAEGHGSGSVSPFLDQGLMELPAGPRVDLGPTLLTVILQTGYVGAEEGSELAPTSGSLAFVTHLVVQNIWFDLHLSTMNKSLTSVMRNNNLFYTSDTHCCLAHIGTQNLYYHIFLPNIWGQFFEEYKSFIPTGHKMHL